MARCGCEVRTWAPGVSMLAALVAAHGCKEPTQISLEITTDFSCDGFSAATITVGSLGRDGIEERPPTAMAPSCDPTTGRVGSLVVVPSGSRDEPIAFKIVGGRGKRAEDCAAPAYGPGCIVARRALRFIPSSDLFVPVVLRASCSGVLCTAEQTCVRGACAAATIADPSQCIHGCDEAVLAGALEAGAPADAGLEPEVAPEDARAPDASADTGAPPPLCPADLSLLMCYGLDGVFHDDAPGAPQAAASGITFAPGRAGRAASFAASTPSYATVPSDPRWNAPAFTIEAWIWPGAYPVNGRGGIIDCGDRAGMFLQADGLLHCHATDLDVATNTIPLGSWTHVACVFDSVRTTITAYQNGAAVRSGPSGVFAGAGTTYIGADAPAGGDYLDGRIDNLRVWSTARTPAEVAAAANR